MDALQTLVQEKITRSQNWFFARQKPDGHWRAELEGDALLQGELIIILAFLGKEDSPLAKRLAQQLINTQAPDGGWPMFPGGKSTVPNTVKAYFALKLTGHPLSADTGCNPFFRFSSKPTAPIKRLPYKRNRPMNTSVSFL